MVISINQRLHITKLFERTIILRTNNKTDKMGLSLNTTVTFSKLI